MTSPGSGLDMADNSSSLITKRKIQEMVAQIDPNERLEPEVEDVGVVPGGGSPALTWGRPPLLRFFPVAEHRCFLFTTLFLFSISQILLELADEFIESVTQFACRLATHRKSSTLEVKDVQLHLGRDNFHESVASFYFARSLLPQLVLPLSAIFTNTSRLALPFCREELEHQDSRICIRGDSICTKVYSTLISHTESHRGQ
jgi:hypothetical protein